jgi:hypothetical protein
MWQRVVCPINGLHNVTELYLKGKTEQCGGQAGGSTLITLIAAISDNCLLLYSAKIRSRGVFAAFYYPEKCWKLVNT